MKRVLITGANGAVGRSLLALLVEQSDYHVIASDIRLPDESQRLSNVEYIVLDVCDTNSAALFKEKQCDVVIHLASIVTPSGDSNREREYAVDVDGTQNILKACVEAKVKRVVISSSGAAYGYYADNADWLTEDEPIRGNQEFAYAWHKRLVEELLGRVRQKHPQLEQVVLRIGTVLGEGVDNQITALFNKPQQLAVMGSDSPFVFIWNKDLAQILVRAIHDAPAGIYNVAGDGALTLREIAGIMGKPCVQLPAWLLKTILAIAHPLKLVRYGPEQVRFLQYRPVLDNSRLKQVFGYTPRRTSREVFEHWYHQERLTEDKQAEAKP